MAMEKDEPEAFMELLEDFCTKLLGSIELLLPSAELSLLPSLSSPSPSYQFRHLSQSQVAEPGPRESPGSLRLLESQEPHRRGKKEGGPQAQLKTLACDRLHITNPWGTRSSVTGLSHQEAFHPGRVHLVVY